jgi:hypothetical protein
MRTPLVIAALLIGPTLVMIACKQDSSTPAGASPNRAAPTGAARDDVYTGIRGVVTMLPIAGNPATELKIQHEHIPTFLNKDGQIPVNGRGVPGMASMVMPFPVAEGLDISSMAIGDKVSFDFTVYWGRADGGPAWEITRFEKLDPATELDFTNTTVEDAATDTPHDNDGDGGGDDHSGHDHP